MMGARLFVLAVAALVPTVALAQTTDARPVADGAMALAEEMRDVPVATTVRLILALTALTFIPALLLVMTPFTRFIIVFSLLRQALGLQGSPPNQVLIGLAVVLSTIVMGPTLDVVRADAVDPFLAGDLEPGEALAAAEVPMRTFMLAHTRGADLEAVLSMRGGDALVEVDDVPFTAVVSAFVLSELKTAFVIGVKIYLPFLMIDLVVANVLLGMGMMVLPPVVISLPFKLLLFVLMDGWNLLVRSMAAGFA